MKMKKIFVLLLSLATIHSQAQNTMLWNKKKCAVVLTYDDGLNTHLNNVVPVLDSFGLKGTFYISDYFNGLNAQIPGWRKAAAKGHELANHTVWHACEGGRAGREFVQGDYDLRFYSVRRMQDEMRTMNNLLKAIDGKTKRTFAYPCGDTKIHDTAYIDGMQSDFVAARAVRSEMPSIDEVDLYNLPCYMMAGQSGEEMIAVVKQAMGKGRLLIFLFHGVGGEHGLNVSLEAHRKLLQFLQQNQKQVWVAPLLDVAEFVKQQQSTKK